MNRQALFLTSKALRITESKMILAALALALSANCALGEESTEIKPPGMPPGVDWKFNFDATIGTFGFSDPFYTNPKPDVPSGDLSSNWMEGSIKPALSGVYTSANSSQIYGKISGVGERTYSAAPSLVGGDASSFDVEDLYIGWRSGDSISHGNDMLDFSFGRTPYKIGHGMLLSDGSADGGSRGGYWTNARKAWKLAAIGRFKLAGNHLEMFYLEKDELPEADSHNKLAGANYEYTYGEDTTLGATYMKWNAEKAKAPQRDGLNVYDLRAFTAPFPGLKPLSFELEFAREDNGKALDSYAWNALVAYQFQSAWQAKISYRYAFFQGDNPATPQHEGFDGLSTGFYDWGTWWQGEIGGEYFLSNSNLISHQFRIHTKPTESLGSGLIFYDFLLDRPTALAPHVTSDQAAYEIDWYTDWSINKNFTMSFVAALAEPNKALEQYAGRTKTFSYGMLYAAYSF